MAKNKAASTDGITDTIFKKKTWDNIRIQGDNWKWHTTPETMHRDKQMHEQYIGWDLASKL